MTTKDISTHSDLNLSNYLSFFNSIELNIKIVEVISVRDRSADCGKGWIGIESIICRSETKEIHEIDIRFAWNSKIFKQHLYDYECDRLTPIVGALVLLAKPCPWHCVAEVASLLENRSRYKSIVYLCSPTTNLDAPIQHHLVPNEFIIGNYWKRIEHFYIALPYPHPFKLPQLSNIDLNLDLDLDPNPIYLPSIAIEGGLRTKGIIKIDTLDRPLISVITVVYNGEKRLEQTIQSIVNQDCNWFEYIIIDGGSDDRTLEIIKKYDPEIDYWISAKDRGIYDAMNKGIDLANGRWLSFMNCEDLFVDRQSLSSVSLAVEVDFYYSDSIIYYANKYARLCACSDKTKVFIHQAIVYQKRTHDAGKYLVHDRLIVADYLFFRQHDRQKWIKLDRPLSIYSMEGISSNSASHYAQKLFVDLISGDISELKMSYLIIIKNIKDWIKLIIRWKG
jgi:hypothetical protein